MLRRFIDRNKSDIALAILAMGVCYLVLLGYNAVGMYDFNNYFLIN